MPQEPDLTSSALNWVKEPVWKTHRLSDLIQTAFSQAGNGGDGKQAWGGRVDVMATPGVLFGGWWDCFNLCMLKLAKQTKKNLF